MNDEFSEAELEELIEEYESLGWESVAERTREELQELSEEADAQDTPDDVPTIEIENPPTGAEDLDNPVLVDRSYLEFLKLLADFGDDE